jgi:hypothetical protein
MLASGWILGEEIAIQVLDDWVKKYSDNIIFKFKRRNGQIWKVSKDYNGPSIGSVYVSTPKNILNQKFLLLDQPIKILNIHMKNQISHRFSFLKK